MKVEIEYCGEWNYLPKATSLVDEIKRSFQVDEKLIRSGGGVFEVIVDGKQIFSKKRSGRFPDRNEIVNLIKDL